MNVRERYNNEITILENQASWGAEMKVAEITQNLADRNCCSIREMNAVFKYLIGMPVQEYVRERRMMNAYKELIEASEFDAEKICFLAGYESTSQSTFNNKFKERFSMTPGEAFEKKDSSKLTAPKTWEYISSEYEANDVPDASAFQKPATKFGINLKQYQKMQEAADLQELYEFNEVQSEVAFELAEKYNAIPMRKIFEFIHDLSIQYCSDTGGAFNWSYKPFQKEVQFREEEMKLALTFDLSVSEVCDLRWEVERMGYSLDDLDDALIAVYVKGKHDFSLPELVDLYQKFKKEGGSDFDAFLQGISWGFDPEEAENPTYYDVNQYDDAIQKDYEAIEKWASAETDYYSGDYSDKDVDVENMAYEE